MRIVLIVALASCLAWSVGEYVAVDPVHPVKLMPNSPYGVELSHDNGDIQSAWIWLNGAGTYAGVEFDEIPDDFWALRAIKYFVWSQGWPDSIYQGFGVACWKMVSGTPGNIIWPTSGGPAYNPNTGGNWIIQYTGWVDVDSLAPEGFVVGIGFLYSYPYSDAIGVDNTGVGPYDWAQVSGTWQAAPYGKGATRALDFYTNVEPTTLGSLRALYR
jgi:hypothetical protein